MSRQSKNDPPDRSKYSQTEIWNGLYRRDREAWEADRGARGLPTTPRPDTKQYTPAELENGLYRKDLEDWERAGGDGESK